MIYSGKPTGLPVPAAGLPSLPRMAASFSAGIAAEAAAIAARQPPLDQDEIAARRAICAACPHRRADDRCALCGCFLAAKTAFRSQSCPVGKWSAIPAHPAQSPRDTSASFSA